MTKILISKKTELIINDVPCVLLRDVEINTDQNISVEPDILSALQKITGEDAR